MIATLVALPRVVSKRPPTAAATTQCNRLSHLSSQFALYRSFQSASTPNSQDTPLVDEQNKNQNQSVHEDKPFSSWTKRHIEIASATDSSPSFTKLHDESTFLGSHVYAIYDKNPSHEHDLESSK